MKRKLRLPAFLPVIADGRTVFVTAAQCRDDPALRAQVVRRALRELAAWRDRYADLFAFLREERLARVARAIDRSQRAAGG